MKASIETLLILLICSWTQTLVAQNAIFYDKETIGSLRINAFCQDSNGYLWIGTNDGLRKFDGSHFVSYTHSEEDSVSLADNEVHTLFMDSQQNLWVGTARGLQRYFPESDCFRTVSLHGINGKRRISDIIQRTNGELLCNVSGTGVFSVNPQSMTAKPLYMSTYSYRLFEDNKQQIWLLTDRQGVVLLYPDSQEEKQYPLSHNIAIKLLEDLDGRFFVVTASDIFLWKESTNDFESLAYAGSKKEPVFTSALLTSDGNLLLSTYGQGCVYVERGKREIKDFPPVYNSFVDISQAKISSLFEDNQHNLWIGCIYQGALMYPHSPLSFSFWNQPALPFDKPGWINTLYCDKENTVWCAVSDNGLYRLDENGNMLQHIHTPGEVFSIFEDSNGTFWLGINEKGLYTLNRKSGSLSLKYSVQGSFSIRCITEDLHQNLYVSILGKGVLRYHLPTGIGELFSVENPIAKTDTIENNWISSILCDSEDRVWFGHFGSISCYDVRNNVLLDLPFKPEIKSSTYNVILEGKDHTIWMATKNGLLHYYPGEKRYSLITTQEGLSDNVVCGLAQDKNGNLWCATLKGISQVIPEKKQIINYYSGNGLQEAVYLERRCAQSSNGKIYFGGYKGITGFNPENVRSSQPKRMPVITDMYIRDRKVTMQTRSGNRSVISEEPIYADRFNLSFEDNTFAFFVSTMDFRNAGNILYEYRLKGIDKEWNKTQPGESKIRFHYLQPGNYTLQIRACENGGHSPVKSVQVRIFPPWYLSVAAKFIYGMLLLGVTYLLYIAYRRKQREEISEMKLQFFINIAHEIRSPLTLIVNPLEKLLAMGNEPNANRLLLTVKHNTNRILNLVNQLLDIRRIDKRQIHLHYKETNIKNFLSELMKLFGDQAQQKAIQLNLKLPEALPAVWIDPANFDKVLINLLSNAFKYTPEGGAICVEAKAGTDSKYNNPLQKYMEISISDTGKGLNEKELKKIFERFYQGDANRGTTSLGFGIGLNLCRLLVKLHHGIIFAENRKDTQGSRFVIRIPLGCRHLKKEELTDTKTYAVSHEIVTDKYMPNLSVREKAKRSKTNYHILVIDDDEELRSFLKENLSVYYRIDTASDGEEGWKKAITQQPDIIVSDVIMPHMDGFQLLKELKRNPNTT